MNTHTHTQPTQLDIQHVRHTRSSVRVVALPHLLIESSECSLITDDSSRPSNPAELSPEALPVRRTATNKHSLSSGGAGAVEAEMCLKCWSEKMRLDARGGISIISGCCCLFSLNCINYRGNYSANTWNYLTLLADCSSFFFLRKTVVSVPDQIMCGTAESCLG